MSQVNVSLLPLWKKLLFTAIPIGLFLGLMEIGLRMTTPMQDVRALCFHPIMERDYCPGVRGAIKYGIPIEVNQDGMIDQDYPVERVPGTLRVAVLGDSFTAGEEVGMKKRFHELWEERLPKQLGKPVEFLNFGVRGFGTWEAIQMFHLKAAKYKPDLTVLNFFWGNDIDDNINQLNAGTYNPLKNEYPEDSLWNQILVTRKNFNKWLWNHSAAYQWFRTNYNLFEFKMKLWLRDDHKEHLKRLEEFKKKSKPSSFTPPSSTDLFSPSAAWAETPNPAPPPLTITPEKLDTDQPTIYDDKFFPDSEGMRLTKKLILKLKEEVEQNGGRLAVIHFIEEDQLYDYPAFPLNELNRFLQANAIPHFDTYPGYRKMPREELAKTILTQYQDQHFSEFGHQVYADMTEKFILGLLSRPPGT